MTRDLDAWKEEHNWHHGRRQSTQLADGEESVFAKGEVNGMSRDGPAKDEHDELAGLCAEPASRNLLVRSNSVAY